MCVQYIPVPFLFGGTYHGLFWQFCVMLPLSKYRHIPFMFFEHANCLPLSTIASHPPQALLFFYVFILSLCHQPCTSHVSVRQSQQSSRAAAGERRRCRSRPVRHSLVVIQQRQADEYHKTCLTGERYWSPCPD